MNGFGVFPFGIEHDVSDLVCHDDDCSVFDSMAVEDVADII